MPRIVYVLLAAGGVAGGQKMAARHVETLVDLGFDATLYVGAGSKMPEWFDCRAPIEFAAPARPEDIVVVPEDAPEVLETVAKTNFRAVVLSQGANMLATQSLDVFNRYPGRFTTFLTISPGLTATIKRLFPDAMVEMARCFADERLFRPGPKRPFLTLVPRKRQFEAQAIRAYFRQLYPQHSDYRWSVIHNVPEAAVARAMGDCELHLALPRMESVGITTLEAMASGAIVAGFMGVGGAEYATTDNGFWAPEEDCLAAADALARAHDLVKSGGRPLEDMRRAAAETARRWSYAAFKDELEAAWMRLAPDARSQAGRA